MITYIIMVQNNNNNILNNYYLHFVRGNRKDNNEVTRRKNKKSIKLNNNYDKLFFNFLIISNIELLNSNYNKNDEINIKYNFAQKMENMKIKKLDDVINNLCYEENINLKTLSALCQLFSKTMYYYCENIYLALNECETSNNLYIVKKDFSISSIKEEKNNALREMAYIITNIDKPFYSITRYKLDELKEISNTIGLNNDGKKKDIYERINQHLFNAIF